MTEELGAAEGISRRDMLRTSAIVGGAGALAWAAPSVTKYGGAAFGATDGTPVGKGLSYIAIRYSCEVDDDGNPIYRYIKFDDYDPATGTWEYETGPNLAGGGPGDPTPGCATGWEGDSPKEPAGYDDRLKFTLETTVVDGEPVIVTVCLVNPEGHDCIIDGHAFGKCGAPQQDASGGECLEATPVGNCVTFSDCGF